jgi:hypothetical protein
MAQDIRNTLGTIAVRACSSRRCRRSRAIGRRSTTGARCEARLNALPQFITEIDGLDIHFIHVRSKHENALPLIVTHGWPGSIIEQLKIIDPLTNPTAHGASASDAFHLVIPSLPGYGFSGKPTAPAGTPSASRVPGRRADASASATRGTWRRAATGGMPSRSRWRCRQPPGLLGIHTNMPATVPADISKALAVRRGRRPPASHGRRAHAWDQLDFFYKNGLGYARRWRTARRRCTGSRIRRSASPPGCSTTTPQLRADRARLRRTRRRA